MSAAKLILQGHVVTMNDAFEEHLEGSVYIDGDTIRAVRPLSDPPPAGFEQAAKVVTKGTMYPGLIELHNHLSYNVLPLWHVPKKYDNRDQWPDHPEYHQLVTGPMKKLGTANRTDLLPALVRYVESKCLFGGVTTSQGIALSSNAGVMRYYKGVVRNVESGGDAALPSAKTHIADVDAHDWDKFLAAISGSSVMLLHLSEGRDQRARNHFLALEKDGKWALTDKLVGIHCAALVREDFDVMRDHGSSMVWSPFSNYLLYGETADIKAALKSGLDISLGSDWSPSGSKSLLGELKVARVILDQLQVSASDRDLVSMVTRSPARMVKWDKLVGSLEPNKRADVLVLNKKTDEPYKTLILAHEEDISLVVIDGVPRYGSKTLMNAAKATSDEVTVAGHKRHVQYHDAAANPEIDAVTLGSATSTLKTFFGNLPDPPAPVHAPGDGHAKKATVRLVLDELDPNEAQRPMLPYHGHATAGWSPTAKAFAASPKPLVPIDIDPLTVKDDEKILETVKDETNLPDWLKAGIKAAY